MAGRSSPRSSSRCCCRTTSGSGRRGLLPLLEGALLVAVIAADPGAITRRLAEAARGLDRAGLRARRRLAVVDRAADRRARSTAARPTNSAERAARGGLGRLGCRTTSRSRSSTGSSTAAARRRAPTSCRRYPDLAFPQQLNPSIAPPGLAPAVRRLPLPRLHERDRVQPDRRDAARALGQDRDGGAGGDLARDPRSRDRAGRERLLVAAELLGSTEMRAARLVREPGPRPVDDRLRSGPRRSRGGPGGRRPRRARRSRPSSSARARAGSTAAPRPIVAIVPLSW